MKEYFARLSSMERRFVVGVFVVVFIVLNAVFVWPWFSDWSRMKFRIERARRTVGTFEAEIAEKPKYEKQVKALESEGLAVPPENQSVEFSLTIQSQAAQSGVNISSTTPLPLRTNQFFIERGQSLATQSEEPQLVDFLYNLGSGNSLIRVRSLSLRPDPPRQHLAANITLIASYQKNPPVRTAAPAAATLRRGEPQPGQPVKTTAKKP